MFASRPRSFKDIIKSDAQREARATFYRPVVPQREWGGGNGRGVGEVGGRMSEGRGLASDFWHLASGFRLLTCRQTPRHAGINSEGFRSGLFRSASRIKD